MVGGMVGVKETKITTNLTKQLTKSNPIINKFFGNDVIL